MALYFRWHDVDTKRKLGVLLRCWLFSGAGSFSGIFAVREGVQLTDSRVCRFIIFAFYRFLCMFLLYKSSIQLINYIAILNCFCNILALLFAPASG